MTVKPLPLANSELVVSLERFLRALTWQEVKKPQPAVHGSLETGSYPRGPGVRLTHTGLPGSLLQMGGRSEARLALLEQQGLKNEEMIICFVC